MSNIYLWMTCLSLFSTFCSFLVSKTFTENVFCQHEKVYWNSWKEIKKLYKLRFLNHTGQERNVSLQNQGASNGLCFLTFFLSRHTYNTVFVWHWWFRVKRICLRCRRCMFDPWVGKIPWRREWQTHSSILAGKCHGAGSLQSMGVTKSQTWLSSMAPIGK